MADNTLAVTSEYIRGFVALYHTEMSWPDDLTSSLANQGLDILDVLHVLKHGQVIYSEKETADGVEMASEATTPDGISLIVKFWIDVNSIRLRIRSVKLT
jgi:hypothetical protein